MAWNRWAYIRWATRRMVEPEAREVATRNSSSGEERTFWAILDCHCSHSNHQQPSKLKPQRCITHGAVGQNPGVVCGSSAPGVAKPNSRCQLSGLYLKPLGRTRI